MRPISLSLRNFLSFSKAKIDLADRGVILVIGRTNGENATSSNGAGKSSIWDAIVWCLYGKTIRNVEADAVINERSSGGAKVVLKLKDEQDRLWRI